MFFLNLHFQVKEAEKIRVDDDVEEEVFEAISKRMWTDVLLQILKVCRSLPYDFFTLPVIVISCR